MATWPSGKRFTPLVGTFKESPPDNLIRSSMDKGPEKVRRRTTANIRPISFTLLLSKADTQVLDSFYTDDLYSGADEFTYTHPRTEEVVTARFASTPEYNEQAGSGFYKASISLEIMP